MSSDGVAAVDRALAILHAFEDEDALSLAELAHRTGLYKSTILRLAVSLERAGFLRRQAGGTFRLGPQLLVLGMRYRRSFSLEEHVMPVLNRLAAETGESASLYVRDGAMRTCLFRVHSTQHRVLHYVTPGTQLPLETGASGRVILTFDREGASALERLDAALVVSARDRKAHTAALACPVFATTGTGKDGFVGALSLSGPLARFGERTVRRLGCTLLARAAELTLTLGGDAGVLRERLRQEADEATTAPARGD